MTSFEMDAVSDTLALLDQAHTSVLAAHAVAEGGCPPDVACVLRAVAGTLAEQTDGLFDGWWEAIQAPSFPDGR